MPPKVLPLVCPHRPPCPGCPRFGELGPTALARQALEELAGAYGAPPPRFRRGSSTGYRYRGKLAIRGRAGSPKLGIFEEGSHRVVHIPRCVVHHPRINEVAEVVRRSLAAARVPPYSDAAHAGLARYLAVAVERASGRAQVVLVVNAEPSPALELVLDSIRLGLGEGLHGLWLNTQTARTNTIFGERFHHVAGLECLVEEFGGARVFYPPGAFGQSNTALFAELVGAVHALIPAGQSVLELYAGSGAIGLGLVERSREVAFNEIGAASLRGLSLGLSELPPALSARTRVLQGSAVEHVAAVAGAQVVIADPPRKGLEPEVLRALLAHRPARFVYVSCGLPAFLSQARELLGGGFALESLTAFELFPHSEHLEVVGAFVAR